MNEILRLFPPHIGHVINESVANNWGKLQEIRLRLHSPIELNYTDKIEWLTHVSFTIDVRNFVLNQLSEHSLYRLETELQEGFITISGGHRVGLAGKVTTLGRTVKGLQWITSFNIRIAQQIKNIAEPLIDYLLVDNEYAHTLLIGAPQSGKTTLLRELIRMISTGSNVQMAKKVAIIDERSEIASAKNGVPQFDIGNRTDVMDACPKAIGMMMMIRSMSPEVIVVDEIGKEEDVQALLDVFHAGVTIICTVHGSSLADVSKRLSLRPLFSEAMFKRYILLSSNATDGFTYKVYDESHRLLTTVFEREWR